MESPVAPSHESPSDPKQFPRAVVYVLQCIDNYYYIGSTVNDPRYRLNNHKQDSVKFPERPIYTHINSIGWDNVLLEVVEEFPCNTREELYEKEDELVKQSLQDTYCLNHIRAFVSKEERKANVQNYYLTHRQEIIDQHKVYLEANKDKVDAYHAAYRLENAEKRREYSAKYVAEHPEEVKAARHAHYEANKEEITQKNKAYVEANKELVKQRKKAWAEKNKEKLADAHKVYAEQNKEAIQKRGKEYYEKNKEVIQEKNKAYYEANKEGSAAYGKEYREKNKAKLSESHACDCGGKYTLNHRDIHNASKRHTKFLAAAAAPTGPVDCV
jgi:hypothetical protein